METNYGPIKQAKQLKILFELVISNLIFAINDLLQFKISFLSSFRAAQSSGDECEHFDTTKVLDLHLNEGQGSRGQFSMEAEQPSGAAQDRSLQQCNMGYDSRMKLKYGIK